VFFGPPAASPQCRAWKANARDEAQGGACDETGGTKRSEVCGELQ
jgi:hypothetical protein